MTSEQPAPAKNELLDALRRTAADVVAKVSALDDATLAGGRYENGWNAKEILAHMASIEWAYPRLIDLARGAHAGSPGRQPPPAAPSEARPAGASSVQAKPGGTPAINDYNARQVAKRAGATKDELIAEFQKNRAALITAVQQADDGLFSREITSAGGAEGPLAAVLQFVAVDHVRVHLRDLIGTEAAR